MIFKGGILGGAQSIHHDPYLNGTTILFDSGYFHFETLTLVILEVNRARASGGCATRLPQKFLTINDSFPTPVENRL